VLTRSFFQRFRFEDVPEESVCSQLKKLKKNKIVGIGEIPVRLLKDSAEIIAKPLTILIKIHYLMGLCQVNGNLLVLFPCLREGRPRTWITTVLFLACLRYPSY